MLVLIVGLCINMGSGTKVQAESIQRPTPINQVFPDPGLANAVKQNLGKQSVTDLVSQRNYLEYKISMEIIATFNLLRECNFSLI